VRSMWCRLFQYLASQRNIFRSNLSQCDDIFFASFLRLKSISLCSFFLFSVSVWHSWRIIWPLSLHVNWVLPFFKIGVKMRVVVILPVIVLSCHLQRHTCCEEFHKPLVFFSKFPS
jgi:hypothetical protein